MPHPEIRKLNFSGEAERGRDSWASTGERGSHLHLHLHPLHHHHLLHHQHQNHLWDDRHHQSILFTGGHSRGSGGRLAWCYGQTQLQVQIRACTSYLLSSHQTILVSSYQILPFSNYMWLTKDKTLPEAQESEVWYWKEVNPSAESHQLISRRTYTPSSGNPQFCEISTPPKSSKNPNLTKQRKSLSEPPKFSARLIQWIPKMWGKYSYKMIKWVP